MPQGKRVYHLINRTTHTTTPTTHTTHTTHTPHTTHTQHTQRTHTTDTNTHTTHTNTHNTHNTQQRHTTPHKNTQHNNNTPWPFSLKIAHALIEKCNLDRQFGKPAPAVSCTAPVPVGEYISTSRASLGFMAQAVSYAADVAASHPFNCCCVQQRRCSTVTAMSVAPAPAEWSLLRASSHSVSHFSCASR